MANEYLKRTPTSSGNRRVWSWSGWVKLDRDATSASGMHFFTGGVGYGNAGQTTHVDYIGSVIRFANFSGSSYAGYKFTETRIRDVSSWVHVLAVLDTTAKSNQNRTRIYINGVEDTGQPSAITNIEEAGELGIGQTGTHYIGAYNSSGTALTASQYKCTDIFFVDGQALTPDVFGFHKPNEGYVSVGSTWTTQYQSGSWAPKKPSVIKNAINSNGGFGSNGYYLPMNDSSNVGADFHTTPNSIIKLKGEDLPQPQNGAPTTSDSYVSQLRQESGTLGFDGVVKFDGTGDYLRAGSSSDFAFGSGDFTIEFRIYFNRHTNYQEIFDFRPNEGAYPTMYADGNGIIYYYTGSANRITSSAVSANTWHHIAVTRSGTSTKLFINGSQSGSTYSDSNTYLQSFIDIGASGYQSNYYLQGYVSNFRVIKGTALYTSTFTPPTEPLTAITNTKLLCCNSSTSATAATVAPASITANGDTFATRNELTGSIVLAVPGISTATGANLVTNPSFESDLSGWTAEQGTVTWSNGSAYFPVQAGTSLIQDVTTVVGKRYTMSAEVSNTGNTGNNIGIELGETGNLVYVASNTILTGRKVFNTAFTATSTSTEVRLWGGTNASGYWSNVTLKQEDAPRDYSADIKGSGTNKTLTANGNAGVGYEIPSYYGSALNFHGTSNDYIETPHSTDFNFGSGDFTVECWRHLDSFNSGGAYLAKYDGTIAGSDWYFAGQPNGVESFYWYNGAANTLQSIQSSNNTASLSQWDHIAACRKGNQISLFVNGVCVGTAVTTISLNDNTEVVRSGADASGSYQMKGRLQDLRIYKGVAKYKGGFDVPKPYEPVGIATWRAVSDNVGNNFCNLNSLFNEATSNAVTLTNGNLSYHGLWNPTYALSSGTVGVSTGKWYWEAKSNGVSWPLLGVGVMRATGIGTIAAKEDTYISGVDGGIGYYINSEAYKDLVYYWNGVVQKNVGYSMGFISTGDFLSVALDLDTPNNGKIYFAKNGVWGASGNPATGSNPVGLAITGTQLPAVSVGAAGSTSLEFNFGQNPTFTGMATAGTFADGNGKGLFKYEPPTGFLALCEDNLPTPAIADPGDYFKTVLYTGDGATGRSVTGVGFKPDLIWLKNRTGTNWHVLCDSVRGPNKLLFSNSTNQEADYSGGTILSFDSDGYSVNHNTNANSVNASGANIVAWCWKAGGPVVSNTAGDINANVSANQTAGFSIVSYSGVAAADSSTNSGGPWTIAHGLGKKPDFMIFKARTTTHGWYCYHQGLTATQHVLFSSAAGAASQIVLFRNTEPTNEFINVGGWDVINRTGHDYIAYCWSAIEGFSNFGSYEGNGNAEGPFVWCGFQPAWIMIKRIDSAGQWNILDIGRDSANPRDVNLLANGADTETYGSRVVDFVSNGFKPRNTAGDINADGGIYIFAAFASTPFKTARAK